MIALACILAGGAVLSVAFSICQYDEGMATAFGSISCALSLLSLLLLQLAAVWK